MADETVDCSVFRRAAKTVALKAENSAACWVESSAGQRVGHWADHLVDQKAGNSVAS